MDIQLFGVPLSKEDTDPGVTIKIMGLKRKHFAALLAAFLTLSASGGLKFRGSIIAWLLEPAIESKAEDLKETIFPLERLRTDSVISATNKPISQKLDRIQAVLEDMPEGQQAIKRLIKRKDKRVTLDSI